MSNVVGKTYGMTVITPLNWWVAILNRIIFWLALYKPSALIGLVTLSLIHYARWVIIDEFPRLDKSQPKEELNYKYMLFFSNFNGSWDQYVDSFTFAIPSGLNAFWRKNIKYPGSVPPSHFHNYIRHNQIDNNHYYTAYPSASSNDVKSAKKVFENVKNFEKSCKELDADVFQSKYFELLNTLQQDLGEMRPSPVVSMAIDNVAKNCALN